MPRAPNKLRVPSPHSSEVDELADDAPTGLTPPRPRAARSSSTRTSTSRSAAATATKATSMPPASKSTAKRGRSSAAAASVAPSTTSSSTRLETYRCQAKLTANTSTLYENNSVSPIKRARPVKVPAREASPSSSSAPSTKRRRRTADTDENDRAALQPKVKLEDEFVFVMPDLDEDGEPIVHPDSDAPAPAPAPRSSPPPLPAASSPFRPSPTKLQRSPFRAVRPRPPPPRTSSPAHLPPSSSSIDLPDALAERVYARSSPPLQQQQIEPHTSTTLVAGDDGPSPREGERSSSPPFVPRGRGRTSLGQPSAAPRQGASTSTSACATPRVTAHTASSQRALTSEEKHEVSALLAELEVEGMGEGELQEGAFETYVETCVEPVQGAGARRVREAGRGEGAGEAAVDPDKTLVDIPPAALDCADAASSPSPSPAAAAANPFAADMPLPAPAPTSYPAIFRSPTPPAPAPARVASPPSARAAPRPLAASPPLNRQYHPATPPRRPPGYRLVPLTVEGLASHAREVVAATASSGAPSTETTYLRGEVRRLAVELEARDKLLGERDVLVRGAQGAQERFERERGEWAEERRALVAKVDALREVRRGLLRELREEQERGDGLEDRVRALEGASERAAAGTSDVEQEPVVDVPPAAQPALDGLEAVDAVEPVEAT